MDVARSVLTESSSQPQVPGPNGPQFVLDFAIFAGHPLGGPIVPQRTYARNVVHGAHLEPPIMFFSRYGATGCGILLLDALCGRFTYLLGANDTIPQILTSSVSLRIEVRLTRL